MCLFFFFLCVHRPIARVNSETQRYITGRNVAVRRVFFNYLLLQVDTMVFSLCTVYTQ